MRQTTAVYQQFSNEIVKKRKSLAGLTTSVVQEMKRLHSNDESGSELKSALEKMSLDARQVLDKTVVNFQTIKRVNAIQCEANTESVSGTSEIQLRESLQSHIETSAICKGATEFINQIDQDVVS